MRTHWSTLADTRTEVEAETLGDRRSDTHAVIDILAASLAEVEGEAAGDTWCDAHALVDTG